VALTIGARVAPWLCKDTARRPRRLVVRPPAELRRLESVPVREGEICRAFRESTSGSPAAGQERWKCSSTPNSYNLPEREALVERPSRQQGRESVATSASSSTFAPIAETRWIGEDRTQPAGHLATRGRTCAS
jgi:hypothetical protein